MKKLTFLVLILIFFSSAYSQETKEEIKGELFIIGGGKRPPELIQSLVQTAAITGEDYIIVLPMSSSEPDTSFFYAKRQFENAGFSRVFNYNFSKENINSQWLDSLKMSKLIYISGGDQNRFMDIVLKTAIHDAIKEAYKNGATIAGTSAGAAVMSKRMITGNEYKYPEYTGEFRTIEANNIEIKEGLGLLEKSIVDQHFVRRMRMNRLITTSLENPGFSCIGIDESTAIIVKGNTAEVAGTGQVVVIRNKKKGHYNEKELLGGDNLLLSVFLPGEKYLLEIEE